MSKTFSIACNDCKVHFWISQANHDRGHIYTGEKHAAALHKFLMDHRKHSLVFDENCESDIAEYMEIEYE